MSVPPRPPGSNPPPLPPVPVVPLPYASGSYMNQPGRMVHGAARRGRHIIAPDGCDLGPRCVKCNQPGTNFYAKSFTWYPPGALFALFLGLLPGAIILLVVQKKGIVNYQLCPDHVARRRNFILLTTLLGLLSPALLIAGCVAFASTRGSAEYTVFGVAGIVGFLISLVAACVTGSMAKPLAPTRIRDGILTLKGGGTPFLDALPNAL